MADQDEPRSPRLNIDPEGEARYPIEKMTRGGRRRASADDIHKTAGRMPPQAMDVEQSVLGAMLLEKEAIARAVEVLPQGSFYDSRHGKIYQAILSLFDRNNPVDLVTVSEELKRRGELDDIGGSYYLTELTAKVATSANVEYHARIIAEKSLLRQFIEVASLLVGKAYEPGFDAFELLDEAEREIFPDIRLATSPQRLAHQGHHQAHHRAPGEPARARGRRDGCAERVHPARRHDGRLAELRPHHHRGPALHGQDGDVPFDGA